MFICVYLIGRWFRGCREVRIWSWDGVVGWGGERAFMLIIKLCYYRFYGVFEKRILWRNLFKNEEKGDERRIY